MLWTWAGLDPSHRWSVFPTFWVATNITEEVHRFRGNASGLMMVSPSWFYAHTVIVVFLTFLWSEWLAPFFVSKPWQRLYDHSYQVPKSNNIEENIFSKNDIGKRVNIVQPWQRLSTYFLDSPQEENLKTGGLLSHIWSRKTWRTEHFFGVSFSWLGL